MTFTLTNSECMVGSCVFVVGERIVYVLPSLRLAAGLVDIRTAKKKNHVWIGFFFGPMMCGSVFVLDQ